MLVNRSQYKNVVFVHFLNNNGALNCTRSVESVIGFIHFLDIALNPGSLTTYLNIVRGP